MIFAVTDPTGEVLGLFRMPDATIFSIDVAVAKARNVAYYADPAQLQAIDQIPGVPAGVAFTNRTFRFVALPHFPEGLDNFPPGPFSILNDGGRSPTRATRRPAAAGLGLPERPGLRRLQPPDQLPRPGQHPQPERHRLLPGQRPALQGHQRRRHPRPGRRPGRQRRRRRPGRRRDLLRRAGLRAPGRRPRAPTRSSSAASACRTRSSTATPSAEKGPRDQQTTQSFESQ